MLRKLGHLGGCVGFLLCPFLFQTFWWPLILVIGFTGILLYARWKRPNTFRGTGGSGRPQAFAEIHFPATGIVTIAVGWGVFNQPWLAVVPLLFMGGGDAVTGLVRNRLYKQEMKGNWGSIAMAVACLLFAYFIHPYYIGLAGAATAVFVERFTPAGSFNLGKINIKYDDNLSIPIASFAVMLGLWLAFVK